MITNLNHKPQNHRGRSIVNLYPINLLADGGCVSGEAADEPEYLGVELEEDGGVIWSDDIDIDGNPE